MLAEPIACPASDRGKPCVSTTDLRNSIENERRAVTVRETSIEVAESVFMAWARSERDPSSSEPRTFDLHRKPNRSPSFGHGITPASSPIAPRRKQIALTPLLESLPDIRNSTTHKAVTTYRPWVTGPFLRACRHVPAAKL